MEPVTPGASRGPARADAQANREKILAVAREALQSTSALSMQSVARAAGVGQGTLYRHFPTKEDLILAVHRHDVDALVEEATTLLSSVDPREALRAWLHMLGDYGHLKHGLADVLDGEMRSALAAEHQGPVVGALSRLVEACQRSGWMRTDVRGADVLQLVGFLWRLPPSADRDEIAGRLIDVVVDGLRVS